MNRTKREIECLSRLQQTTSQLEDILIFLKLESLITDSDIKTVRQSADYSRDTHVILRRLQNEGKIQLLEYQWEILPVERIKILLITDRAQKEFIFNT